MEQSKGISLRALINTFDYCQSLSIKGVNSLGERTACFVGMKGDIPLALWEIYFVDWTVKTVDCDSDGIINIDCADKQAEWQRGSAERFSKMYVKHVAECQLPSSK